MLNGLKIGTRIKLGFGMLVLLLLVLIGTNFNSGQQISADLGELQVNVASANNGDLLRLQTLQMRRFEKDMILNLGNKEKVAEYLGKWQKAEQAMQQALDAESKIADADEVKQLQEMKQRFIAYRDGFRQVSQKAVAGEFSAPPEVNEAMKPFTTPTHELEKHVAAYVDLQLQHQRAISEQINATIQHANNLAVGVGIIAILLALLTAWLVTHSIQGPLTLLESSVLRSTRERDLRTHVEYQGKDEIGSTISAINGFFAGVRELVTSAQQGCAQLNDTAGELRHVSDEQNRAIAYQAEATASTAAAIEQLTVSISHVADTASGVERQSRQSQQLAMDGRSLAVQTASEINRIADSIQQSSQVISSLELRSAEIGGIVHVIKDIADQTNLLALNAAIEAARAGEQGRGFAVVADEVRKLAENTTHATNQISGMIQAVQQDTSTAVSTMQEASNTVTHGVSLTQQVAEALDSINQMATESADNIAGVAVAISQQGAASTQIAQNIEKIAQMSEENSAATSHLASLAQNLNQLSDTLGATIKSYKA
ncbi:MAG: methyl-accepting chemotaxis protein [Chitinivorax sp.]